MENVPRNEGFSQVCVWPGTIVGQDKIEDFTKFFLEEFNTRIQYLEEIKTNPDTVPGSGRVVPKTGGRNDVLFAVCGEDIGHFAVKRLSYGMRWIEDVYGNDGGYLYPERVAEYKTW